MEQQYQPAKIEQNAQAHWTKTRAFNVKEDDPASAAPGSKQRPK